MEDLSPEEIDLILRTAETFKEVSTREIKKVPTLRGRTVINLFFEPSTRTRTSFEIAGKRLSADVINISPQTSSMVKGESLIDMVGNLRAMNPDLLVFRHRHSGSAQLVMEHLSRPVINAGDGMHEHPSQALLDLFTIRERKGKLAGLNVSIIGDIGHSRVARSNIIGMKKMNMRVTLACPKTFLPRMVEPLVDEVTSDLSRAIRSADVIMVLRIQLERLDQGLFPSIREYSRFFGLNETNMKHAKKEVVILHPGPINRGVEISPEVADGPFSLILDQVTNGVAVRMALLFLLLGSSEGR
jgi:aspartate carbamoyltransferase catalytic subunit